MRRNGPAALAAELQAAVDRGEPDDGSRYYQHWLATLERLVTEKGLTDSGALLARKEAWADAYRHTPHGKPCRLASGPRRLGIRSLNRVGFHCSNHKSRRCRPFTPDHLVIVFWIRIRAG